MARKRVGAPKKPFKDKVSALTITVKNETIEKKGGKKACRELLLMEVEKW